MSNIQINGSDCTFSFGEGEQSLLRAALRSGVGFPHECNVGSCGACKFTLESGEVESLWPDAPGLSANDVRRGKYLACQCRPITDEIVVKVRLDAENTPKIKPVNSRATLEQIRHLNYDTAELTFRTPNRAADFLPGQYALLGLPNIAGGWRAYSMSNTSNSDGIWQFIVRRVPNGGATSHLFDKAKCGDEVDLDGPYGHAWLRNPEDRDLVCIAGGSGLAPMLSIARGAAQKLKESGRKLTFVYGGRQKRDLIARPFVEELEGFGSSINLFEALSDSDADQSSDILSGYLHDVTDRLLAESISKYEIYLAGPGKMIEAFMTLLMEKRQVSFGQIHFDRYF